ncbi:MAG TPA: DedA family protein [Bryobacteraceae bacterium]|nr:DedA family protein [Bryobacteraceae bacterium]
MEGVFAWIGTDGYGAIFLLLMVGIVGLPIPDETILVFCGYLISQGKLEALPAYGSALAGSWCGISVSYAIGRSLGPAAVHRYGRKLHISEEQLVRVHNWFNRWGHWTLAFGYFVAGMRHLTAIAAGMSKLEFPYFAIYAWTGGAVWTLAFLVLGYFLGENWRTVADLVGSWVGYLSIALILAVAAFLLARKMMRRGPRKN